ncbi:MAG: hypothetical protein ABI446_08525 [Gemmatimonadaceae bacterium]
MRRMIMVPALVLLCACPGDKKAAPPPLAQDTTPVDLSAVKTDMPAAAPDTFKPPVFAKPRVSAQIPNAPPELLEVVQREQAFSKFCYQEFGEKADPSLQGGVAMVVTVNGEGLSDAKVRADSWTSKAGTQVNGCLNERATRAWKIPADAVKPGQYVVQLAFRPT